LTDKWLVFEEILSLYEQISKQCIFDRIFIFTATIKTS